jgi:carboxymethylenebutenolidase
LTKKESNLKKASDFHPQVMRLFNQYVHGEIDRRGFLDAAARYAVGGTTAAALLEALSPRFAQAQQVPPDDKRLHVERIEFASPRGSGKAGGYLVRPANATGKLPAVLVAHENRGLNPHIEDVSRRLALANYIAFAPDGLFPLGGYPGTEDEARTMFTRLDPAQMQEDFVAAAAFVRARQETNGRLGAVGFCWGGGMVNVLATRVPELRAAAPFYGPAPKLDAVPRIKAELLLVFAGTDDGVNGTWPPYEAALKKAGVKYEAVRYPGTYHGFHNNTTPRYDEKAAAAAWQRTLALFERTLRS